MRKLESLFIASVVLVFGVALIACGGGDGQTAEDRIPDLSDEGFALFEEGRDPFADANVDTHRALYQSSDGRAVIIVVYIENSTEAAQTLYGTLSSALENPPPEFFGGEAEQDEEEPLQLGDERRAFVTATADNSGNRVWTDIYRSGEVILITQVLAGGDSAAELRQTVAEKVI